ncbi:MAG TPA: M1 family aminopeptidase [Gemmatimonadales bacterium]|nr:M1 family aminopeptidase [Gemmatimonadales bacterium]
MQLRSSLAVLIAPGLFAAVLAAPLAAQTNADLIRGGRYGRAHDYDLVHQRIELRNFSWDSLSFDGRVTTTLVARRAAMRAVALDAGALLDVRRVTDARGRRLAMTHTADTLRITLPRAAHRGDTLRFTVAYHGRVKNGQGLTFIPADGRPHRPEQLWSMGETDGNHRWFPTYDFPDDKATWELVATVPESLTAVSNGRLASDRPGAGGTRTFTWAQERPASTYLVSLVVAPLVRLTGRWHDVPLDYFVYPDDSARARRLFAITPDVMDVYARLTGVPYPWAKYAQTTVADFFGGMENVSATTLVDWLPDSRAYVDRPWYQRVLIPHELAHQWFGDLVTLSNWANMWLNEGFAEFMPGQFWRVKEGQHAADDYYLEEYSRYLALDARRAMPLASMGSNNIYPKGALVLRMLERTLGEQQFWKSIHLYLTRHAYGNAASDDLRRAILDATGQDLNWFFDQWVYQAGYPEFTVRSTYDSAARALTLSITQTQRDSLAADSTGLRFTVPRVFRGRIAIRVGQGDAASGGAGDVVREVELTAREQSVTIDSLAGPPTMVVFDDGNRMLKTLDFEQPTAWLATQLARDPDLWNRAWVIGRLAERTDDAGAAAALARAARASDFDLTRAQAAQALASFPAAEAGPPLVAAAADTSARVRQAAVSALAANVSGGGGTGGAGVTATAVADGDTAGAPSAESRTRALGVARAAWTADSSDQVRAAALLAIVALDSAGARAAVLEGLRTPSYRDAIQTAAIVAAARSADPSLVRALADRAGDQQLVTAALAAMAAGGDSVALDQLASELDDDRPWVRRWALEVFRGEFGRTVGRARLQAVADGLKHADARTGAAAVVQGLGH